MSEHSAKKYHPITILLVLILFGFSVYFLLQTFNGEENKAEGPSVEQAAFETEVQQKWNKPLEDLPIVKLVVISPHQSKIRQEFEEAFFEHYVLSEGKKPLIWWDERCGGGSSAILHFLLNDYGNEEINRADVVFGGGQYMFEQLAEAGLLAKMEIGDEVLRQIPEELSGLAMYDKEMRWCGNALSGFGFLYNRYMLEEEGAAEPTSWADLGKAALFEELVLTDPGKSGSATATYEIIVQSAEDWPRGWSRLLMVLSNARWFMDNALEAANAPVVEEAAVTTCIDFYGRERVEMGPDYLEYVSPQGETVYTPDPIAILHDAPNKEMAQAFVDFVLSAKGQALWMLEPDTDDGPMKATLNRAPIRRDVYATYGEAMPAWMENPYEVGEEMEVDAVMWTQRPGVLGELVRAAAIENRALMQAAKKRLIETDFEAERLATFTKLPENVDSEAKVRAIAKQLKEEAKAEQIKAGWKKHFHDQFLQAAR